MTTIDEIMAQANRYALRNAQYCAAHITNTDLVSGEIAALRHLITQAIAEARAEGEQSAVARMFPCCGGNDESPAEHTMDCPDKREPVRLTDEQIDAARENLFDVGNPYCPCSSKAMTKVARWAERAVLAKNGLTK